MRDTDVRYRPKAAKAVSHPLPMDSQSDGIGGSKADESVIGQKLSFLLKPMHALFPK